MERWNKYSGSASDATTSFSFILLLIFMTFEEFPPSKTHENNTESKDGRTRPHIEMSSLEKQYSHTCPGLLFLVFFQFSARTHTNFYTHLHTRARTHTHAHTHTHTNAHTHTRAHTYTRTHTHTHTHTRCRAAKERVRESERESERERK